MSGYVDLHLHTTFSDGTDSPARVLELAAEARLAAVSITDHDTVTSYPEAAVASRRYGVELLTGVEASLTIETRPVHLLVYLFELGSPFTRGLAALEQSRRERVPLMLARLAELGMPLTEEEVRAQAGGELLGRPHFAGALVKRGYVRNSDEAFDRYLGNGKPAHLTRDVVTAEEAMRLAHASGGVCVVAHPGVISDDRAQTDRVLERLVAAGLDGIEVQHPAHGAERRRRFGEVARRHGLVATGGSDYHGRRTPRRRVGRGKGGIRVPYDVIDALRARRRPPSARAEEAVDG